jgi:hypothetical protein
MDAVVQRSLDSDFWTWPTSTLWYGFTLPFEISELNSNGERQSVGAVRCDLNNDGYFDVMVANIGPNEVLINDGTGNFNRLESGDAVERSHSTSGLVCTDFNNDGYDDVLVFSDNGDDDEMLINEASILVRKPLPICNRCSGNGRVAADFNGDGHVDLYFVNENSILYINDGNGGFSDASTFTAVFAPSHTHLDVSTGSLHSLTADFNNDGYVDMIILRSLHPNEVLINNGDGSFTQLDGSVLGINSNYQEYGDDARRSSEGGFVADFNNDGYIDVMIINRNSKNEVHINNGDSSFVQLTTGVAVERTDESWGCVSGDFNRDGYIDVIVLNGDRSQGAENEIIFTDGEGNFHRLEGTEMVQRIRDSRGGVSADFNNDGALDVIITNSGELLDNYQANDVFIQSLVLDGGFIRADDAGDAVAAYQSTGPFMPSQSGVTGDFNEDGHLDVMVMNADGKFHDDIPYTNQVLINNGDGSFNPPPPQTGSAVLIALESYAGASGDFNNDGHVDVTVFNRGPNKVLINDGAGSFTQLGSGPVSERADTSRGGVVGDFNNDGFDDVMVFNGKINPGQEKNELLINDGDGNFIRIDSGDAVERNDYSAGGVTGDFNNDGHLDIMVCNRDTANEVLINNGDGSGSFTRLDSGDAVARTDSSCGSVSVDFNNDGHIDVMVMNCGQANEVLINNADSTGTFTRLDSGPAVERTDNSQAGVAGDFNNDGYVDLMVMNAVDEQNAGQANELLINNRAGNFFRVQASTGSCGGGKFVQRIDASFGGVSGDFNNDGFDDIMVMNFNNDPLTQSNELLFARGCADGFSRIEGRGVACCEFACFRLWIRLQNETSKGILNFARFPQFRVRSTPLALPRGPHAYIVQLARAVQMAVEAGAPLKCLCATIARLVLPVHNLSIRRAQRARARQSRRLVFSARSVMRQMW